MVIGLSFLGGTLFRSNTTNSFGYGALFPIDAHSWSVDNETGTINARYFWPPRDIRMEIQSNATIDVYILDDEGVNLWQSERTLKPLWAFQNVTQQVLTKEVLSRGEYAILIYNPTESSAGFEINATLYGFEKDLIILSIIFSLSGLAFIVATLIQVLKLGGNNNGRKK
jgi:hypothetical protein